MLKGNMSAGHNWDIDIANDVNVLLGGWVWNVLMPTTTKEWWVTTSLYPTAIPFLAGPQTAWSMVVWRARWAEAAVAFRDGAVLEWIQGKYQATAPTRGLTTHGNFQVSTTRSWCKFFCGPAELVYIWYTIYSRLLCVNIINNNIYKL